MFVLKSTKKLLTTTRRWNATIANWGNEKEEMFAMYLPTSPLDVYILDIDCENDPIMNRISAEKKYSVCIHMNHTL